MSRISLWRIDGNPPRGQFRACSTVNCLPQMQWEGRCAGCQPYRKHSASLKAPLWRANPCSSMGKVESQLEAPFSADTVNALWRLLGSLSFSSEAAVASCCLRRVRILFLALSCSVLVSDEYVCDCCRMRAISGAVIFSDALLLAVLWREGSMMPSPPSLTGNAIRSLSASLKAFWPVRDGKKRCLMAFSTGLSKSPMSGMVLERYVLSECPLKDVPRI